MIQRDLPTRLVRALPSSALPAEDLPEGVLRFVLCRSGEVDGHGTIIEPAGVDLSRHRRNPVFLWQHQSGSDAIGGAPSPDVVIGRVIDYDQSERELIITVQFDMADEFAAKCYRKTRDGFISGVSIGCRVDPEETVEREDGVAIYRKTLLLEASLVIIPSLASALVVGREMGDGEDEPTVETRSHEGIDFAISKGVRAALERALSWIKDGFGGDGLTDGAKRDARRLLDGGKWWPEKVRKANAFFARHGAQAGPWEDEDGNPTPKRVAWDLWGGDPGESQVKKLSGQMDKAEEKREEGGAETERSIAEAEDITNAPASTEVQSVIFDKSRFSLAEARKWLSDHDFKVPAVDETEESYRFRQREPGELQEGSFRTIELADGIKAVIGKPKEREDMPEDHIVRPMEVVIIENTPETTDVDPLRSSPAALADAPPPRPLPYAGEGAAVVGTPTPYEIAYTSIVEGKRRRRQMMDKRMYRAICRGLINHEFDGAEMHGYAAEMDEMGEEARALHKGEMREALKRAEGMTRLIAIDLDDDEGEGGVARAVPAFKDSEARSLFAAVAQKAGPLPPTLRAVVQRRFNTVDAIEVDTRALAANGAAERLKAQALETRRLAAAAQSEERERLIAILLDPRNPVITPAEADEMRGIDAATKQSSGLPAWNPERVQTLARERGASTVTDITRTAPLRTVEPTAAAPVAPAPIPGRPTAPTTPAPAADLKFRFVGAQAPQASAGDLEALIRRAAPGLGTTPEEILRKVQERVAAGNPIVPGATSAV